MNAQQLTNSFLWVFCINISIKLCCLNLDKTISKIMRKRDLYIWSTFIAMTDSAIDDLVVWSSLLVIRPRPYFCFASANARSIAIRSALSAYSVFLSVFAFLRGLPSAGPDKQLPSSLQNCRLVLSGRFYPTEHVGDRGLFSGWLFLGSLIHLSGLPHRNNQVYFLSL